MYMLMDQVYLEEQLVISQDVVRIAGCCNTVIFRKYGDPRMEFIDHG